MSALTDPNLRATDADREECMQVLREAAGEGALSLDELEDRLTAAAAAIHRRDLPPLIADLPQASAVSDALAPSPTDLRPEQPSKFWIWAMIPWLAVGAWVHASVITRQTRYWPLAAIYAVPLIAAMIAAPGANDELPGWVVVVGVVFWIVGAIQGWMARPAVDASRVSRTP